MVSGIVSYYIDVITEVEYSTCHKTITELRAEALSRYNQVSDFFALHIKEDYHGMNCLVLNRAGLNSQLLEEGQNLIHEFFIFLIVNKITNLDVVPHGMYCDVTLHWINHLLGNPECIKQKNIFNVMVSPKVNWYSQIHNTSIWNQNLDFAANNLTKILDDYCDDKSMFILRCGSVEELFDQPSQLVSVLTNKIKQIGSKALLHSHNRFVGNHYQQLHHHTTPNSSVPYDFVNVVANY